MVTIPQTSAEIRAPMRPDPHSSRIDVILKKTRDYIQTVILRGVRDYGLRLG